MKKALKVILWCVAGVFLLLVVALATLPLWLGPTVTAVANGFVPKYTGTAFKMTSAELNPYTGKFRIRGIDLANPAGYSPEKALALTEIFVDVEMASVFSDVIHIREIVLSGPYASYVTEDGTSNFEQIAANAQRATATSGAPAEKPASEPKPAAEEKKEAPAKKVVIDRFAIVNPRLKVLLLPEMPFADIVLKDIGRESNGATLLEVGKALLDAVMKAATAVGKGLGALATGTATQILNVSTNLSEEAGKVLKQATTGLDKTVEGAAKGLDKALGAGAEGVNKTVEGAAKGLDKALGAGAEGVSKTVEGAAKGLDKATKKFGDLLNFRKK